MKLAFFCLAVLFITVDIPDKDPPCDCMTDTECEEQCPWIAKL